jgi:hypothetical protein
MRARTVASRAAAPARRASCWASRCRSAPRSTATWLRSAIADLASALKRVRRSSSRPVWRNTAARASRVMSRMLALRRETRLTNSMRDTRSANPLASTTTPTKLGRPAL